MQREIKPCPHEYWQMVAVPPDDCDHECFCDITGHTCSQSYVIGTDGCDPELVRKEHERWNKID